MHSGWLKAISWMWKNLPPNQSYCGRGISGFIQDLLDSFSTDLQTAGNGGTIEAAAEVLDPALHLWLFRHILVGWPHGDWGPLGFTLQGDPQHHSVLGILQRYQTFSQTDPQQRWGGAPLLPAAAAAPEAARGALVTARISKARTAPRTRNGITSTNECLLWLTDI